MVFLQRLELCFEFFKSVIEWIKQYCLILFVTVIVLKVKTVSQTNLSHGDFLKIGGSLLILIRGPSLLGSGLCVCVYCLALVLYLFKERKKELRQLTWYNFDHWSESIETWTWPGISDKGIYRLLSEPHTHEKNINYSWFKYLKKTFTSYHIIEISDIPFSCSNTVCCCFAVLTSDFRVILQNI